MTNTEKESLIHKYYQLVDTQAFAEMYQLFEDTVVYQRCESTISGMVEFKRFYEQDRTIVGTHTIDHVVANSDDIIAVMGRYHGKNAQNNMVVLSFSDFFTLSKRGKIAKRNTYLAQGFSSTT